MYLRNVYIQSQHPTVSKPRRQH